jgi:ABC-2 type transport system ATP-binding protein
MEEVIKVQKLSKIFKGYRTTQKGISNTLKQYFFPKFTHFKAVDQISFSISQGECVALVGPNGAGKSTTIKMLTGVMNPTSGSIRLLGKNPTKERKFLAKEISVLFGHASKLWYHLPVKDSFSLLASIYGLTKNEYIKRKNYLVSLFSVAHLLEKPVRQLSLGERMRCELIGSFLHNPKVVFLDEPTIGLDIIAKATIRELLKSICKELQCTLLLTSHDTDDIEKICNRMIIINKGTCVVDDNIENIKQSYLKKKTITIATEEEEAVINHVGLTLLHKSSHQSKYEIDLTQTTIEKIILELVKNNNLRDMTIEGPSLETVIKSFY